MENIAAPSLRHRITDGNAGAAVTAPPAALHEKESVFTYDLPPRSATALQSGFSRDATGAKRG
jgi:hypothetical protein